MSFDTEKHERDGRYRCPSENSGIREFCLGSLTPCWREAEMVPSLSLSPCLTVLGWVIGGTASCKLLQLGTAPPPPIHPEIGVILGHQAVVIPCFCKSLYHQGAHYQSFKSLRRDPEAGESWVLTRLVRQLSVLFIEGAWVKSVSSRSSFFPGSASLWLCVFRLGNPQISLTFPGCPCYVLNWMSVLYNEVLRG